MRDELRVALSDVPSDRVDAGVSVTFQERTEAWRERVSSIGVHGQGSSRQTIYSG